MPEVAPKPDHVAIASIISPEPHDTSMVTNVVLGTIEAGKAPAWKARFIGEARRAGLKVQVSAVPLVPRTEGQAIDDLLNLAKSVGLVPHSATSGRYDSNLPKPPIEDATHIIQISLLDPAPGKYRIHLLNAYGTAINGHHAVGDRTKITPHAANGWAAMVERISSERFASMGLVIKATVSELAPAAAVDAAVARMVELHIQATHSRSTPHNVGGQSAHNKAKTLVA